MMVLEREFASLEHDLCRSRQAGVPQNHQLFDKHRGRRYSQQVVRVSESYTRKNAFGFYTSKHIAE